MLTYILTYLLTVGYQPRPFHEPSSTLPGNFPSLTVEYQLEAAVVEDDQHLKGSEKGRGRFREGSWKGQGRVGEGSWKGRGRLVECERQFTEGVGQVSQ